MINIINNFMYNLSLKDIETFLNKEDIFLNQDELRKTYVYVKNNYLDILKNPNLVNYNELAGFYTKENFVKITKLIQKYYNKYDYIINNLN